jgi:hypothetical protein
MIGEPLDRPRQCVTGRSGNEQQACQHLAKERENKRRGKGQDGKRRLNERACQKGNCDQRQDNCVVDTDAKLISRLCRAANVRTIKQR